MTGTTFDCENMALSQENQEWVRNEIEKAIKNAVAPPPISLVRTRKLLQTLRDWGLTAAIYAVPLALLAAVVGLLIKVVTDVTTEAEFRGSTKTRLDSIEKTLAALNLRLASTAPTDPSNQELAKTTLEEASKRKIKLPLNLVEQTGKSFVDASGSAPSVWKVALKFVDYRAFLNSDLKEVQNAEQIATTVTDPKLTAYYGFLFYGNGKDITVTVGGDVPYEQAARMHRLSDRDPNIGSTRGKEVIMFRGGSLELSGMLIQHVVFKDSQIYYSGGPLVLRDVVFVNCTFGGEFGSKDVRNLASTILSSTRITFRG